MKLKKVLIFLITFVVLVGIYLIMENPFGSKKEEVKKEVLLFANFKPENQVKIEISYDKKNVLLKKKNDKWLLIKNEKDYPADEKAVKEVLDKVKNFNKKDIISKNPKKQKLFEVTKGKGVEVKIFDKNNKMTAHFFVGKAAPDFFSTYVRKEGSSEVVVAKGYLPSVFKKEVNDWRDKQIFKFDKENVAKISIKSKEKEIVLIKADTGKWNIVKPEKMKAEKKKVYEFLREISDLKAISFPDEEITEEVQKTIDEHSPPPGIKVGLTGMPAIIKALMDLVEPDMQRTSRIALIAIFIIVLLLFRSLKYGILPLLGVALGTLWMNGTLGLLGIKIKPETSGVTSMVLGIGIDFGIQIVNRFRLELEGVFGEKLEPEEAITETLARVIKPIGTTTLAALIGLRAMEFGRLTFMKELADMMSLGIVMCMLSALTLIPSLLIITEKMKRRRRSKK